MQRYPRGLKEELGLPDTSDVLLKDENAVKECDATMMNNDLLAGFKIKFFFKSPFIFVEEKVFI